MSSTIQALVKYRKLGIKQVPHRWLDVVHLLENYTPKLQVHKVLWELPREGWIKVNTDGASRENPKRSAIGFCMRNELRDVVYACGREIPENTNIVAEALAVLEALRICSQRHITHI